MPLFDMYCDSCDSEEEDVFLKIDEHYKCKKCNELMKRCCNTKSFKLLYNNKTDVCGWSDSGYAKSEYYRKVDEARAGGLDAHAPSEN